MKIKARIVIFITLMFLIMIAVAAYGASIVGSKHDLKHAYEVGSSLMKLSMNNYGEVCVYCHTPHSANTSIGAPLWNKECLGCVLYCICQPYNADFTIKSSKWRFPCLSKLP